MRRIMILAAAAMVLIVTGGAWAAEVEVKLLSRGRDGGMMVFEPAYVKIAPGDTVKFQSAARGYNANAIKGMLPDGARPIVGKKGEDLAVRFEREGVYGVKCLPHHGICMVLMVGAPPNIDQAKQVPSANKAKQATLLDKASKTASR